MATTELLLVPRPRRLDITGTGPQLDTPVERRRSDQLPAEGFAIEITESAITLSYADDAGARYGSALLEQIRRQAGQRWPALTVEDWPDFPVRGYMLDISRGRVPTRATLDRVLDVLELARINQVQLYTEHTFAYSGHEEVWRDASPMTPDDLRWLDDECAERGIELVANQNTFGHMEHWLSHPRYRDRAELPDGFELFGQHRSATTLAPTADNAEFAVALVEELLGHIRSRRVNIGCDETWELGRGASADAVARHGKGRVYLDHLLRLLNPLLSKGYDVQFWGDIIAHHPELVSELPAGATAVAWTYEAPREAFDWPGEVAARFREAGVDPTKLTAGFAHTASAFTEAGYPFWVEPGTSGWRTFTGRIDNAKDNLVDAADVGRRHGAGGYLITDWGDLGHMQPPSVSFPAIVYGGAVAWSLDTNRGIDLDSIVDTYIFDDATGTIGQAMDRLARVWSRTGITTFNASPLFVEMTGARATAMGEPDGEGLDVVVADIDSAISDIQNARLGCADAEVVAAELIAAARLARHGAYRMLRRAGRRPLDMEGMAADLAEAIELHKAAWDARSRSGGREIGVDLLAGLDVEYR